MLAPFKKLNNYPLSTHQSINNLVMGNLVYNDYTRKYYCSMPNAKSLVICAGSYSAKREWHTFYIDLIKESGHDINKGKWFMAIKKPIKPKKTSRKCRICKKVDIENVFNYCVTCSTLKKDEIDLFEKRSKEKREQLIIKHPMIFTKFNRKYEDRIKYDYCMVCSKTVNTFSLPNEIINFGDEAYPFFCSKRCIESNKNYIDEFRIKFKERKSYIESIKEVREPINIIEEKKENIYNEKINKIYDMLEQKKEVKQEIKSETLALKTPNRFLKLRNKYLDINKINETEIGKDRILSKSFDFYINKKEYDFIIKWIESWGVERMQE